MVWSLLVDGDCGCEEECCVLASIARGFGQDGRFLHSLYLISCVHFAYMSGILAPNTSLVC